MRSRRRYIIANIPVLKGVSLQVLTVNLLYLQAHLIVCAQCSRQLFHPQEYPSYGYCFLNEMSST